MRRSRRSLQEGLQVPARPPRCPGFECSPARDHEADHRGRQVLAHNQRSHQGQEGNDVHPQPPVPQAVDNRPAGIEGSQGTRDDPCKIPQSPYSTQVEGCTQHETHPGQPQQETRYEAFYSSSRVWYRFDHPLQVAVPPTPEPGSKVQDLLRGRALGAGPHPTSTAL